MVHPYYERQQLIAELRNRIAGQLAQRDQLDAARKVHAADTDEPAGINEQIKRLDADLLVNCTTLYAAEHRLKVML